MNRSLKTLGAAVVLLAALPAAERPNGAVPTLAWFAARPKSRALTKPEPLSPQLRALAARAKTQRNWIHLRRYAASARTPEEKGLAELVLGYREFEANQFSAAAEDLERSAATGCSLADFAEYYRALALDRAGRPADAAVPLGSFAERYPDSPVRWKALSLLAQSLIALKRPQDAVEALAGLDLKNRPALVLLLAQAQQQSGRRDDAIRTYERVYEDFPARPEATAADQALRALGSPPPPERQAARAQALFDGRRFADALEQFTQLLDAFPTSPSTGTWKVARARCLIRLNRASEAIELLSGAAWTDPKANAERLATLAEAYERLDRQPELSATLDQLSALAPQSASLALALVDAGNLYFRGGDWNLAHDDYQSSLQANRASGSARESDWRAAWTLYLQGDSEGARQAMIEHLHRYADSPHGADTLYWLARIDESRGRAAEARALDQLLARLFPNSYYTEQARREFGGAGRAAAAAKAAGSAPPSGAIAAELAQQMPTPAPPSAERICPPAFAAILGRFRTLEALSLDELARQELESKLAAQPDSPSLLFASGRFETAQQRYALGLFAARKLLPDYFRYPLSDLPGQLWDLLYPRAFWKVVERGARANRVDPYLVMGLIRQESAFNPRATSSADARGLMQMRPGTAAALVGGRLSSRTKARISQRLYDPAYNIHLGCRYLRSLLVKYGGSVEEALAAYNAGNDRVVPWLKRGPFSEPAAFVESIPFTQTRAYVEAVMRDAVIYRQLLAGRVRFRACGPPAASGAPRRSKGRRK